jgi:hypothetical protein
MKKLHLTFPLFFLLVFSSAADGQTTLANFGLKDQNDKYVEVNFPSDRPVVLIFGDRKGAGQIDGWSQPIYKKYEGKVYVFGIASLGGVPSYARGLVRRLIKRQTSYQVLLDWGGKVASSLGYQKEKAMLVVVGKDGTVITTKHGAASDSELSSVYAELDKRLK